MFALFTLNIFTYLFGSGIAYFLRTIVKDVLPAFVDVDIFTVKQNLRHKVQKKGARKTLEKKKKKWSKGLSFI